MTLAGGETAQLPDLYAPGHYDLAGSIVGVVEEDKAIHGDRVAPGDLLIGYASSGLHTNGYSLARKILFEKMKLRPGSRLPGSTSSVGAELLRVHRNYQPLLAKAPSGMIKGLAHITGGGLIDNLPRVLPKNCEAAIETKSWRVPNIFRVLQRNAEVIFLPKSLERRRHRILHGIPERDLRRHYLLDLFIPQFPLL